MISLLCALALLLLPYLITQPHHVRVAVAVCCCALFCRSVTSFGGATELDVPSSTIAVAGALAFLWAVAHHPLSWLSLILLADPSSVPPSERPPPISAWFGKPRQLLPADHGSKRRKPKPASSSAEESALLLRKLERAEADKVELEAKVKQLEGEKRHAEAQRDSYESLSARYWTMTKMCMGAVESAKARRDKVLRRRACFQKAADAGDKFARLEASVEAIKAEADKAVAEKDQVIEEKEKIIEEREKTIEEKEKTIEKKKKIIEDQNEEIAHLNGVILNGIISSGDNDDDTSDDNNGGSPQGGNAQQLTTATEPSGAPPGPVDEFASPPPPPPPPPTTAAVPSDDAAGLVPSSPSSSTSSPVSSAPSSPASSPTFSPPDSPTFIPLFPKPAPEFSSRIPSASVTDVESLTSKLGGLGISSEDGA